MSFFTTKWWTLVLVAMLGAGLAAEGYGQGATPLDGIWMPDGGGTAPRGFPDKMELLNDGTCIFEGSSASWKTNGERLFFMNIGGNRGLAYNYKMSNSELILINDHGQGAKYRKHLPGDKPLPTKQEQEMVTLMNIAEAQIPELRLAKLEQRAERYLDNRMYDKAIEDYTEIIRISPNKPNGYLGRAMAYDGKEDYDRAIADWTIMLRLVPNRHEVVLNQRGYSYLRKGDYDKALADFNKAIHLAPNNADIYDNRGRAYRKKGDYDKAIADFSQALRLDPKGHETVLNQRGYSYLGKGDYDKALADFNKAIQLAPNEANPYDSRGEAYLTKGDYDKAIADYSQALRLDPNFESAKKGLAEANKKKQGR